MNRSDIFARLWMVALYCALGWYLFVQTRYLLRRFRKDRWPIADAAIQKGAIGKISFGKSGTVPASFMGYAFMVQSVRYGGFFALYGDEATVQKLHDDLAGAPLQIRYRPSDPNISFLLDYKDLRFEGLKATQSPEWMNQAPAFDLQDTMRG
jgi:hypothetical protein